MLANDDPEEKRNVVMIKDNFTFRNHVVSVLNLTISIVYKF